MLLAGRDGGPHAFVVALACCAARALGDAAVDHAVTDLLFAVIVRRLDTFGKNEAKVVLRQVVLLQLLQVIGRIIHDREPRSEIHRLLGQRRIANQFQKAVAVSDHRAMGTFIRYLDAAMPGRKQPPRSIQELFGPNFGGLVRMFFFQEPDVAYQVRPTVLGFDPIVPGERTVG